MSDLLFALGGHLLLAPMWLLLVAVIGQSIPMPTNASLVWTIGIWSLFAAIPLIWLGLAGMLIRWWSQGRGPLWNYPWLWFLMAFLNVIGLAALLFPSVRKRLVPPRTA